MLLHEVDWKWSLLALLTLITGSATVNLPGLPATVSVSETFAFTSVLLFGSAAGTLTVALDALVIAFWHFRKGNAYYKIIFNVAAVSLAMWIASHLYYALSPYSALSTSKGSIEIQALLWPLLVFTVVYYALNTWLISFAISLERSASPFHIWRRNFLWIAMNYFGGASVAALLVTYTKDLSYSFIGLVIIIVPLLVILYFTFSNSMGRVEDANRHLSELNSLYMSTIETLAMAIDAKDQITHGHIRRVQVYAVALARSLGVADEAQIRAIEAAALLHDMGKLAVPEYILNKPGPLTVAEFDKMKLHASVGADILSAIPFPYPVVPIVRHHHENWDGTGYPDHLAGSDIPIGARILAVVDCFDALTSDRPYRPRLSDKDAIRILVERRSSMYDPLIVDEFIRIHDTVVSDVAMHKASSHLLHAISAASVQVPAPQPTARFEEITASSEEMLTLFELAKAVTTGMGGQDATDLIAKHLRRLVPSSSCVFFVYDEHADELVAAYASGEHAAVIKGLRVPRGQRLSGWVAANRQTIRNSDPVLDLGESARALTPRPRSSLATPLIAARQLVGVLSLYSTSRDAYTEDHERIIEVVARQVSSVIAQAYLTEQSRNRSLKDEITGLPNLRHFFQIANAQLTESEPRHPFSLIVIRFSADSSAAGTQFHEQVVACTRRALRAADLLFSAGPNELLALLLNTDSGTASAIAHRINVSFDTIRSEAAKLRIGLGLASAPQEASAGHTLLALARDRVTSPGTFHNEAIH
jgi:putative nucleotidyltransferase with HDIG domain